MVEKKKYWLHRITGGENAVKLSHPLLFEHGILSTGWARCSWDDFVKKSKGGWETFLTEFGYEYPSLGNYRSLWNFLQMQEGDIVVVPTRGEFSIYRVVDDHVYTNESLSKIISLKELIDEEGKTAYVDKDKDDYSYLFDADGEFIDLGFYRKVSPIAEHVSRSLCDATLRNYLGHPRTNINISHIATHIDNVINNIKSNKHMAHIRLDRTFWPVGHGAFYTEQFFDYESEKRFTAVYDCGGIGNLRKGKTASLSSPFMEEKVQDFFESSFGESRPMIDILFISHFHRDHINGVPSMLPNVRRIVLPQVEEPIYVESFVYNAITSDTKQIDVDSELQSFIINLASAERTIDAQITHVVPRYESDEYVGNERFVDINGLGKSIISGTPIGIPVVSGSGKPFWVYIPVNLPINMEKAETFLDVLCNSLSQNIKRADGSVDWQALQDALRNMDVKEVKKIYEDYFEIKDDKHNFYSMPVYSGPFAGQPHRWHIGECSFFDEYMEPSKWRNRWYYNHRPFGKRILSCLYTGDFEAADEDNLHVLEETLQGYYFRVGLIQVPHHFSSGNHNTDMYEDKIVAFGNVDERKDISFCHTVYKDIDMETYLPPLVITEKDDCQYIIYNLIVW